MENIENNEMESNLIIEEEIIQNTIEETDFLNTLDDGESTEATPAIDESLLLAQGEMTAVALLGAGEGLVKQFGHKSFELEKAQKENVSKSFAPLFVKYGGELPPWFLQYKEEIMFTFALGTLCFTSLTQVKALKKVDAEKVASKPKKEAETDATS
ncbi:hypothetical protein [Psychromonas sp. Urea-02u-13]|uniref:hypothetical protein n=1 Tax=Psychromonas sp. Urea-02u-13 TaxID=2058326 RepID=UPI000C34117F|nr:hypothetical protein [Psychromonas sp. Urea-02u-13]PKG39708.1 hypothetical protein CXF74_07080 [Psychromonas sp. Urea-02u-13]